MTADNTLALPILNGLAKLALRSSGPAASIYALADEDLMQRVATGDQDAFAVLYHRFERPVFSLILRMTRNRAVAEELLQEAFTRVWLGADSHDPARGATRSWIFAIALNTTRTELGRKRYRTRHVAIDDLTQDLEGEGASELGRRVEDAEHEQLVADALRTLPDFMQEVVILRCSREMTFDEISQLTRTPTGTLKSRFHRAVKAIRLAIEERQRPQSGGRGWS